MDTPSTTEQWQRRIEELVADRCDLDVLLKDELRHRIVLRECSSSGRPAETITARIDGQHYKDLKSFLRDKTERSLRALVLTAFHGVLGAYGHGSRTVIAHAEPCAVGRWNGHRVLPSVVDHAAQCQRSCAEAVEDVELALQQEGADADHSDLLGFALFDAVFVMRDGSHAVPQLEQYPLRLVGRDCEVGAYLDIALNYTTDLFEHRTMAGVMEVMQAMLGQLVSRPSERAGDIQLVSEGQKRILGDWNNTDGDFPTHLRLNELFEAAVRKTPDLTAIVCQQTQLTYRELNECCNRVAHWLLGPGGGSPRELVALYLDKSHLTVITTLAIWKSGASFVPLDPSYPAERIAFTIRDTGAVRVVTNGHYVGRLRGILDAQLPAIPIVAVEAVLGDEAWSGLEDADPRLDLGGDEIAYVAYTSGTTGVPKGVAKLHRSAVNSITDLSDRYDMRSAGGERVALFASYVFEPFLRQMLIALINSQTLVVVPDVVRIDPLRLPDFLAQHGVTYLNGTGSILQHFDLRGCPALSKVLLVGEELTAAGLRRLRATFKGRIINEYSFTETAFVTAIKEFAEDVTDRHDRSIGRPLRNVKCYVLTNRRKQVPVGAIGELYVGGCGIARGYLNRDALTAQSFFANPFRTDAEKRNGENDLIYRTGDLARFLPNGEIEFLGRADFQLKLNGVRVEPGEIEARVLEYPGIRQCIVVARERSAEAGDRQLVGYFVTEPGSDADEAKLRAFLKTRLISVMVPSRMVRLDMLPTNINGKVDRRALPEVSGHADAAAHGEGAAGIAPREAAAGSVAATDLREIWSSILDIRTTELSDDDDFFLLGGQSVACIQLIARIWERLRVPLNVEQVFRLRTLTAMVAHIEQARSGARHSADNAARSENVVDDGCVRLRANGLQQGLMYHAMKAGDGDDAYVVQSVYRYHCVLCPETMKRAWECVQRKYPSLRLRFEWGKEPLQIVDEKPKPLDWRFVDLSGLSEPEAQQLLISQLQESDRAERYALATGPLFRVYLVKQRGDLLTLMFSCHHIIIDGWSLAILHDEVHRVYLRLARGVADAPSVDAGYIAAQRYWAAHHGDHVDYWEAQIDRIADRGDLNGLLDEGVRHKVDLGSYDRIVQRKSRQLRVDRNVALALRRACAAHQLTLHSVMQFAWHKALNAFGGARTTVVGTIVSGRGLPIDGIERSVGLFINTLPLIVDHREQADQSIAAAISDIQQAVNEMNGRATVALGRLRSGQLKHGMFDSLLVFENHPRLLSEDEAHQHRQLLRFEHDYDTDRVDFPLVFAAREIEGELAAVLWYGGELFDDDAVEALLDTTALLLEQLAADFSGQVRALKCVTPATEAKLEAWNRTGASFPQSETLHGLFEASAKRWPDATAVVCGEAVLSYAELDRQANRIAHQLVAAAHLLPDDLVALVVDKNELMIAAILAVWKAGAAYVPIDPSTPDERLSFMLEDTEARLVLTNCRHGERLRRLASAASRPVLELERLHLAAAPAHNPAARVSSTNLAYAIYTSGTTGQPKAVLVEHRGVVNLMTSLERTFNLSRDKGEEAILSFSNYVFDHFVEQMLDALLNGQKLVILDDALRTDPIRLHRYMNDHRVTYLSGTPSVLSMYEYSTIASLLRIDAIGEDLTVAKFNKIRATFDGQIINGYGPTEISITSHKRLYRPDEPRRNGSIGYPVANTTCYVLDEEGRRVPIGRVGELYIGGAGVARGYLNRDELTRERFLTNPFQTADDKEIGANARLYRTGDLVRWLPTGELEYLGRNDLQVKIRGQRVELGEIEAVLSSFPGITRSVVIARERPGHDLKQLVGFYVSDSELDAEAIDRWMLSKLPQAIVPGRIMRLDEIPITPSGKLDVRRLPTGDACNVRERGYLAPSTEIDAQLCRIWSAVLGIAPELIGLRDDFFALGGDSLRAVMLAHSVAEDFGIVVSVAFVFAYRTIEAQALQIEQGAAQAQTESRRAVGVPKAIEGEAPVSFAQERLLFIDEYLGGSSAYNISLAVEIPAGGSISRASIAAVLRTLVRRHPALRTLLRGDRNGTRLQKILDESEASSMLVIGQFMVHGRVELDMLLENEARYVFRLDAELPIRTAIVEIAGRSDSIFATVVAHHTCFDGWSWNIFRRELAALVGGTVEGDLALPQATYADYSVWQRERLAGPRLARLSEFWRNVLTGYQPLNLPVDRPRPRQFDYLGRELTFPLDSSVAGRLKTLARTARVSLFSVLLGAYVLMLKIYTGQDDIVVGVPSANRIRPEFNGTIGLFANLLSLRTRVDTGSTLTEYLRSIGDTVVRASIHQELPFEQLVKSLQLETDPSRHPLVQAAFGLVGDDTTGEGPVGTVSSIKCYLPDRGGATSAKFDLSTTVNESATGMTVNLTYATSLFEPASVANFAATLQQVLAQFARHHASPAAVTIAEIGGSSQPVGPVAHRAGESSRLALEGRPELRTLHGLFEASAKRWPDATAVVCGEAVLSYAELDRQANRIAHQLVAAAHLLPDDLVALVVDKNELMIAAILAVWKAGAAYVPIDPSTPDERLSFMLEDTEARLVLTNCRHGERLRRLASAASRPVLELERLHLAAAPAHNPAARVSSTNLAYAIYTSGTTGQPKAVLVEHRGVVSFRDEIVSLFRRDDGKRHTALLLSNYTFDFSLEQLALSILSGGSLIVPSAPPPSDDFYDDANRHGLSVLSGTPTQVAQLDLLRLGNLKHVLVAGEALLPHHFDKFRREYSGTLFNAYGTTETTVYNLVRRFEADRPYRNDLGNPLPGTRLYIVDRDLQLLPPGAVGELLISGECVSRGYHRRRDLTRERFLANPFRTEEDRERGDWPVLYRTGDLVRRRPDGVLEYLGRNDLQVKIRGVRIELGEVEAALACYPGIRQCAVVAREDGHKPGDHRLVGYYVAADDANVVAAHVFAFLQGKLMRAAIPAALVRIAERLPVTANGKLDTAALPNPDVLEPAGSRTPPRNRLEASLCRIWGATLQKDGIGIDDDFFHFGGDSISALRLVNRIQRFLDRRLSVKLLFDYPTVRAFVENGLANTAPDRDLDKPDPPIGSCPLLPIQRWFLAKPKASRNHWNQYFAIRTPRLELERLRDALHRVVAHHDAFRLRFRARSGGEAVEQVYAEGDIPTRLHVLDIRDLRRGELEEQLTTWQSDFDLELGPLHCAAYLHGFDDGSARIWVSMHHLIVDVVSWHVLKENLEIAYQGGELGPPGTSYRRWASAVLAYAAPADECRHWDSIADSVTAAGPQGLDALSTEAEPSHERFELDENKTRNLVVDASRSFDAPVTDLLLAALGLALRAVTDRSSHFVTLESHGREAFAGAPDVSDSVGWFTTMHPVEVESCDDLALSIARTRKNRLRAPHNGIGFGAVRGAYGGEQAPLPSVSLNYLGVLADDRPITPATLRQDAVGWVLDPSICGTSCAVNDSYCVVDVTARCFDGKMVVDMASRLDRARTRVIACEFERQLRRITSSAARAAPTDPAVAPSPGLPTPASFEPCLLVNELKPEPALFLLPPGDGGAESYLGNLVKHLRETRMVVFNNIHRLQPMSSYEALASYYIGHLRHVQASGPYDLLGWSFGGVLALEMALQLARAGDTISNLILIDPFFNTSKALADLGLRADDVDLDPINHAYRPAQADLDRLGARTGNTLLFKAGKPDAGHANRLQRRLFAHYARSRSNNLETLLPHRKFSIEQLPHDTHFSWIRNAHTVALMAVRITALLATQSARPIGKQGAA